MWVWDYMVGFDFVDYVGCCVVGVNGGFDCVDVFVDYYGNQFGVNFFVIN